MTPEQITLIQTSFKQVALQADAAATNFYHRLFTLQPALRLMFPADLTAQKQKLMTTLGFAVGSLTKFHALIPTLEALGRKHSLYGVR
ncbi:MAG: hemin receptor, partial [Pyrinomonadaceae bacterium]